MVPDTRLRLGAVLKALDDIIGPSLHPEANFAREQLALIAKSIALVRDQIPHELGFVLNGAKADIALAESLLAVIPDDESVLREAASQMQSLLPSGDIHRGRIDEATLNLKRAIEAAVESGSRTNFDKVASLVVEHSTAQAVRERGWIVATGFDLSPAELPSLADLAAYEQV
jgi:hypothetical protein